MKVSMTTHRCYFSKQVSIAILLSLFVQRTFATPYVSLSPRTEKKCVAAEFPKRSKIIIEYDVIDFNLMQKDELSITFKIAKPGDWPDLNNPKTLLKSKGIVEYDKHSAKEGDEHEVNICIERKIVSRRPALVSLKIKETALKNDVEKDFEDLFADLGKASKETNKVGAPGVDTKEQAAARNHMTYLEKSIYGMVREADLLISSADSSKEQESIFFQNGLDMHSAAKWWPIMHLLVLFVTGYTQANHIVSFFKSRHII